jgi:beta-glucoside operon transcriptional antiterminator
MHLVNAELNGDMSTTLSTTTAVQDIVALVRDQLGVPLEPDSVAYARFLTHVKFAVRRIEDGQLLVGTDLTLYDMVRTQDPQAHACALAVAAYVHDRYALDLPEEELLYLMVHVNRLRHRDVPATCWVSTSLRRASSPASAGPRTSARWATARPGCASCWPTAPPPTEPSCAGCRGS